MKSPLAPLFLRGEEECGKHATSSLTSHYQSAGNNRSSTSPLSKSDEQSPSTSPFAKGGMRGIFFSGDRRLFNWLSVA